jgi:hypothetical protein
MFIYSYFIDNIKGPWEDDGNHVVIGKDIQLGRVCPVRMYQEAIYAFRLSDNRSIF